MDVHQNKISQNNNILKNAFSTNDDYFFFGNILDEEDENDNLKYYIGDNKELGSKDNPSKFKYSIDLPNVPKEKLHNYLNNELINEIQKENWSYTPTNNKDKSNVEKNNLDNNSSNIPIFPKKNNNVNNNQNYNFNVKYYPNFVPYANNYIESNHSNIHKNGNSQNNNLDYNINQVISNSNIIPEPNNFDNSNKGENFKKNWKKQKIFEKRKGDWTCKFCNNLNFSFRKNCNICLIPKGFSFNLPLKEKSLNGKSIYPMSNQ